MTAILRAGAFHPLSMAIVRQEGKSYLQLMHPVLTLGLLRRPRFARWSGPSGCPSFIDDEDDAEDRGWPASCPGLVVCDDIAGSFRAGT